MLEEFRRLYEFDGWANRQALASLKAMGVPDARAMAVMAHLLEAKQVWLQRIEGADDHTSPLWPDRGLGEIEVALERVEERLSAYLDGIEAGALERSVGYSNTSGQQFTNSVAQILHHLALHGAEHRGQIGDLVGTGGGQPAETEYIWWLRGTHQP